MCCHVCACEFADVVLSYGMCAVPRRQMHLGCVAFGAISEAKRERARRGGSRAEPESFSALPSF